jgi:hypothetical protein
MKTQHSSAPWKWDDQYDSILSEAGIVCKIATGEDKREEDANARLIAAAPDLLKACESMLDWMEFTIPRLGKTPSGSIERMNWGGPISRARDAIAKATGGTV